MQNSQFYLPDHYLSQDFSFAEEERGDYQRILIPLNGLDRRLYQALADLLEIVPSMNTPEGRDLDFIIEETFSQIGDCLDKSHFNFMKNLQGNADERGEVPGYPTPVQLKHIDALFIDDRWRQFVSIFRYYALEIYRLYCMYSVRAPEADLVYERHFYGAMVFIVQPKKTKLRI